MVSVLVDRCGGAGSRVVECAQPGQLLGLLHGVGGGGGVDVAEVEVVDDRLLIRPPLIRPAPGVAAVFDERQRCIAVMYLGEDMPPGFLRVVFEHNGGAEAWQPKPAPGQLLAVRQDRKFALYAQGRETGAARWVVADARYAALLGLR